MKRALAALALVALGACAPDRSLKSAGTPPPSPLPSLSLSPTPEPVGSSPRPTPTPTPTPVPEEDPVLAIDFPLAPGARGKGVRLLQRELTALTYDPGAIDGRFGPATQHAVFAYEKVRGMELDGIVDRREMRGILKDHPPRAPKREADDFVDVDITRQVLFEVRDGKVVHTLPISTGNGAYYESKSGPAIAHTPRGTFSIVSKVSGWRVGYLGAMYYPSYFFGGYAVHGSASVPPYPASHGCVRIPMHSTIGFFDRNPTGTTVYVHD